jgi:hypothetical protein
MGRLFEEKLLELTRKGDTEKVRLLKGLGRKLLPSQLRRIQQNDKTVLGELFLPRWVSWELLFDWANSRMESTSGRECILCGSKSELGIDFNERFVCEGCFVKIKNLK